MKKFFLLCCLCLSSLTPTFAQNVSSFVKTWTKNMNAMSPLQCTPNFLIKDDANGYAKVHFDCVYEQNKNKYLAHFGLWKSAKDNFVGTVGIHYESHEMTHTEGVLLPSFYNSTDLDNQITLYDEEAVKTLYREKLAQMQAKGAEGTETVYAELPQKGTTIKLYIVLASELQKNKGVPIWKMEIGTLKFDKATGKFSLQAN